MKAAMILRFLKTVKQELNIFAGRKTRIRSLIECNAEWYGNNYGGFYVHPNFLNEKSIVYSFGIGEDVSFDTAIIDKHHCTVFAFDPTPKSISWIKNQSLPLQFKFYQYGIDKSTGTVNFNLPKKNNYVSGSILNHSEVDATNTVNVPVKNFTEITQEFGHKRIDILKMDIEGSEYDVLDSILNSSVEVVQILIEIHERFFTDGKYRTKKLLAAMQEKGYTPFAVSNSMEELSFIKRTFLIA